MNSDAGKTVRNLYEVGGRFLSARVTFMIDKQGVVRSVFSSELRPTRHVVEAPNVQGRVES